MTPQSGSYRGLVNTVGPRACYEEGKRGAKTLFHDMQALTGAPFTVYGDGTQTRPCCYIDDMLDGLTAMILRSDRVGTINDPVNLGNPGEFTVLALLALVLDLTGAKAGIVHKDDIQWALRRGWQPHTGIMMSVWDRDAPGESSRSACKNLEPGVDIGFGRRPFRRKQNRFNRLLTDQKAV